LDELATKVLPAVMPLVLDGVGDVRTAAFSVIDTFLSKLKAQHTERSIGEVSSVAAIVHTTQQQQQQQHHQVPPAAPSSGSYLGGISSWYSTSAAPDPVAPVAPPPAQERQRNKSSQQPPSKPTPTFSSLNIGGDTLEDDSGGWDDDDDDLDLGADKEEDVFASIGMHKNAGRSSGKLIMGNKSAAGSSKQKKAEVQKLSMDDELDGWDDF
jgi:SCY1-like protein 1